jgi:hypothetical protein
MFAVRCSRKAALTISMREKGVSRTNRNFVIAYILLVGLPLAGLVGILKHGRTLTAPLSVDGIWKLQIDSTQLANLPCGKSLAAVEDPTLTISQSGERFTLNIAHATAGGAIKGTALTAVLAPTGAGESGCGSNRQLTLMATVDPKAEPRSLAGMLSVNDCPACSPVAFHAVRQVPVVKGAR